MRFTRLQQKRRMKYIHEMAVLQVVSPYFFTTCSSTNIILFYIVFVLLLCFIRYRINNSYSQIEQLRTRYLLSNYTKFMCYVTLYKYWFFYFISRRIAFYVSHLDIVIQPFIFFGTRNITP